MEETAGQFLERLGTDGEKWTEEMYKRLPMTKEELLGWCCNMLMAGYDEGVRKTKETVAENSKHLFNYLGK